MLPIWYNLGYHDNSNRFLGDDLKNHQDSLKLAALSRPPEDRKINNWTWTNKYTEKATRTMVFSFICTMDENHYLDYVVQTYGNKMIKIGQFPSVADLTFPEFIDFKNEIDEQSKKELKRAIGLYAQGIGIGSYVYLRRVFERILDEAKKHAENEKRIDVSNYSALRVTEKIKLLHDYLPEFINTNKTVYGIISKGIHELSEDECINYFPVLKESVFIILNQWAQMRKNKEMETRLEQSINAISSRLSS